MLLLAGATECAIQQHSEEERDGYNSLISPCPCISIPKATIHIMWVKSNGQSRVMNHIIPLLPDNDLSEFSYNLNIDVAIDLYPAQASDDNSQSFIQDAVSYNEICRFCAMSSREKRGKEDMVLCENCQTWYHCSCIGIARAQFDDTPAPFFCCVPPADHFNFV